MAQTDIDTGIDTAPLVLPAPETGFEVHVPVVVAGAGAAGLTAALAARDAGAETWVLERDATPAGSTAMSQGTIAAAGTRSQIAAGVDDDPDRFLADIIAKTGGEADHALARVVAREAGPTVDWLADRHRIPVRFDAKWQARYGHSARRLHGPPSGTGEELLGALAAAAERAEATLITEARLAAVFAGPDGRVAGVRVARPDGAVEDIGCDALVLATCGFGANRAMIAEHIPSMATSRYHGHEGNDGLGIRLGQALGGAVADMGAYQGLGLLAEPQAVIIHLVVMFAGAVLVNARGERFEDELVDVSGQGKRVLAQPGGIAWVIGGAAAIEAGQDTHDIRVADELGAVRRTDTVDGLAALIGCDPAVLAATVDATNAAIASGGPDAFGRDFGDVEPWAPPYFAIKVTGALFHTQGGLVVDGDARVLRPDGSALPNLYAAGGTARSISGAGGTGYLPAAGLCMAVTLGRLAGRAAGRMVSPG